MEYHFYNNNEEEYLATKCLGPEEEKARDMKDALDILRSQFPKVASEELINALEEEAHNNNNNSDDDISDTSFSILSPRESCLSVPGENQLLLNDFVQLTKEFQNSSFSKIPSFKKWTEQMQQLQSRLANQVVQPNTTTVNNNNTNLGLKIQQEVEKQVAAAMQKAMIIYDSTDIETLKTEQVDMKEKLVMLQEESSIEAEQLARINATVNDLSSRVFEVIGNFEGQLLQHQIQSEQPLKELRAEISNAFKNSLSKAQVSTQLQIQELEETLSRNNIF